MLLLTRWRLRWVGAVAAAAMAVAPVGCGEDHTAGITAARSPHVLRLQANGAGSGTVSAPDASPPLACTITRGALSGVCAGAYPSQVTIQVVATPNESSTFIGWSGFCTGTGECIVEMSGERTVTASFSSAAAESTR